MARSILNENAIHCIIPLRIQTMFSMFQTTVSIFLASAQYFPLVAIGDGTTIIMFTCNYPQGMKT